MKYIYAIFISLACSCATAQTDWSDHSWTVTLEVVGEEGNLLAKANAGAGFYTNGQPASVDGFTDADGRFEVSQTVHPSLAGYLLSLSADRDGYYATKARLRLPAKYDAVKWNPTVTLILKKIEKPIAMYAKWNRKNPPVLNQPIGYDLMVGDWVAPYGNGLQTDILFRADDYDNSGTDYKHKVTVSFPNPGDGIQVYEVTNSTQHSDLRSPHRAPTTGFQPELTRESSAQPGKPGKREYDPNRIYLFRVRTKIDGQGNLISAHYGKIYGDFMQFSYYLNSTPNDRNIEFDPKQNLFHDLQSFERVDQP